MRPLFAKQRRKKDTRVLFGQIRTVELRLDAL
jgi:hypothetical protein